MSRKNRSLSSLAYLTPPEIGELLRVSSEKVLGWIRSGKLHALNVGNGTCPRYRVSKESLDTFLASRRVVAPEPRPRRRHDRPPGGSIDPTLGKVLLKRKQAALVDGEYYRVWNGVILFY